MYARTLTSTKSTLSVERQMLEGNVCNVINYIKTFVNNRGTFVCRQNREAFNQGQLTLRNFARKRTPIVFLGGHKSSWLQLALICSDREGKRNSKKEINLGWQSKSRQVIFHRIKTIRNPKHVTQFSLIRTTNKIKEKENRKKEPINFCRYLRRCFVWGACEIGAGFDSLSQIIV